MNLLPRSVIPKVRCLTHIAENNLFENEDNHLRHISPPILNLYVKYLLHYMQNSVIYMTNIVRYKIVSFYRKFKIANLLQKYLLVYLHAKIMYLHEKYITLY